MNDMTEGAPVPEEANEFSSPQPERGVPSPDEPFRIGPPEVRNVTSLEGHRIAGRPFEPVKQSGLRPADRSSVDSLNVVIDNLQPSVQESTYVPQSALEIPVQPPKPGRLLRWAMAGLGIAGALGIGGYVAKDRIGGEEGDNNGAPVVVVPEKTVSPDATVQPTAEPTKEPTKVPEKSPYNFNWEKKFGDVTVRIEDKLQERTECPDPGVSSKAATMVACPAMHEVVLDKENFPNAEEDLQEAAIHGFYFAWQNQDASRKEISYEEYKDKLAKGDDLSFTLRGFQGDSFLPADITVEPTDKVYLDWIAQPASIFRPFTGFGVGYRKINDELHLEVYSFSAGEANKSPKVPGATSNYLGVLQYMSNNEALKRGYILKEEVDPFYQIGMQIMGNLGRKLDNGNYIGALYAN